MRWYRTAAEQGDASAQNNLGVMYANGHGVPQDDGLAVQWYARAAGQGHALAQYNLGGMYNSGRGVEKDPVCGYMWLALAAEGGDSGAARAREAAAARLDPAQLQEAQQRMRQWHQGRSPPRPPRD
ncbi:MAG: tetratricopeptide repeat protein [Janthinobacterium sp.]